MDASKSVSLPALTMGAHIFDGQKIGGFNDYPFTFFYLNGWVMRILGPSGWSARVSPALFGVGVILLTGLLGVLLHSEALGFFAALSLNLMPGMLRAGASFHLEMP